MFSTKNDLPEAVRSRVVTGLNLRLADAVAMQTFAKQAHWNVKGPHFLGLHKLFDEIAGAMLEYTDLIAERVVQLGGTAEGTVFTASDRTQFNSYSLNISTGKSHCQEISSALAAFGAGIRKGIDDAGATGDQDTADMYTEVSRGVDQWLWFVEAHLQADA